MALSMAWIRKERGRGLQELQDIMILDEYDGYDGYPHPPGTLNLSGAALRSSYGLTR